MGLIWNWFQQDRIDAHRKTLERLVGQVEHLEYELRKTQEQLRLTKERLDSQLDAQLDVQLDGGCEGDG